MRRSRGLTATGRDVEKDTRAIVDQLMGNKPEARFRFIQENAEFAGEGLLDV